MVRTLQQPSPPTAHPPHPHDRHETVSQVFEEEYAFEVRKNSTNLLVRTSVK